jgi:hypothetical protein
VADLFPAPRPLAVAVSAETRSGGPAQPDHDQTSQGQSSQGQARADGAGPTQGNPSDALATRLAEAGSQGRPLRVKLGIDPTGSDIHLGHSILFRKLRAFQDAGHTAVLIIGDFTARIGDPTGKSATRVQLTAEAVEANARTYLAQLGQGQAKERALLDFETPGRLEVRRNSEWLAGLDLPQTIELLGISTVGQMLAKEDFANRYGSGTPISLHEFLYPLLQGYDSVAIQADLELGGTDQKFNVAMGRDLQRHFGQQPQFGLLLPILPGLDGVQKMSKSLGNTVGLAEDPLSMYSKLEKFPMRWWRTTSPCSRILIWRPFRRIRASARRRWPWRSPASVTADWRLSRPRPMRRDWWAVRPVAAPRMPRCPRLPWRP